MTTWGPFVGSQLASRMSRGNSASRGVLPADGAALALAVRHAMDGAYFAGLCGTGASDGDERERQSEAPDTTGERIEHGGDALGGAGDNCPKVECSRPVAPDRWSGATGVPTFGWREAPHEADWTQHAPCRPQRTESPCESRKSDVASTLRKRQSCDSITVVARSRYRRALATERAANARSHQRDVVRDGVLPRTISFDGRPS